jgi:rSAM/selenodomain-associated transferase 1
MAKAPLEGQVKTRLTPALNAEEAARLARALLLDQLVHLSAIVDADLYLAFTPPPERELFQTLAPTGFRLFPQAGDDLGGRMAHVFETLYARGHRRMVLIGGDLVPVPLQIFTDAFAMLDCPSHRVVLGPSRDGGYYLVGCNKPTPEIFMDMAWSHDQVFAQTVERLTALQMDVQLLPHWFDIDTLDDLRHLQTLSDPMLRRALVNTLPLLRRFS